jgi:membrane protease YdiL (CAAX protease family)
VLSLIAAAWLMTLIEKRSFADYYLPPSQAFGKRFWQGIPYGFAMLSLLLVLIAAFRGFSLGNMALSGADAMKFGAAYGAAFILVGIFEEFSFRGYMQSTLTSGIGFWGAAVILSIVFGAIHLQNLGEAWIGAFMAGSFGILAAFSLKRTGNIWFPIGMHAAWDWGETYFYSVPDSGFLAKGHLLNSTFHGAKWLTGGSVGPEGSVFAFVVLVIGGVGIHFLFPAKRETI